MLALFSYLRHIPIMCTQYSSDFSAIQRTIFSLLYMSNALIRSNCPVFLVLYWYIATLLWVDSFHWILTSQSRFDNFITHHWRPHFVGKQTHLVNLDSFCSFFELLQSIPCLIAVNVNSPEIIFLSLSLNSHTLYSCMAGWDKVRSLSLLRVSDDSFGIFVEAEKMLINNGLSVFLSLASEWIADGV